jgi:hypothetical protein
VSTAWPAVLAALVAAAGDACAVPVADGDMLDQDQHPAWIELGITVGEDGRAGSIGARHHDLGRSSPPRAESGRIEGTIVAQSGDTALAPVQAVAFGALDALAAAVRANPTLGVDGVLWVEVAAAEVFRGRTSDGAFVELRIAATYEALT